MVMIAVEDVLMARRAQKDELTEQDREMIGTYIRFEIPMHDIYKLRQVADLMRGYADKIDHMSRRTDWSIRAILLELKMEGGITAKRIKALYPSVFRKRWADSQT